MKTKTRTLDSATQKIIDRLSAAYSAIPEWRKDVRERIERSLELNTRIGACTAESALQEIEAVARSYRLAEAVAQADREVGVDTNA